MKYYIITNGGIVEKFRKLFCGPNKHRTNMFLRTENNFTHVITTTNFKELTNKCKVFYCQIRLCTGHIELNVHKRCTTLHWHRCPVHEYYRQWSHTYLWRSNARTVPSREELTTTLSDELNTTQETAAECSVNVTKQNPVPVFHNFTCHPGRKMVRERDSRRGFQIQSHEDR